MSIIDENFYHRPIFPKVFGEYKLHFSDEEEKILEKWKSRDHAIETSLIASDEFDLYETKPYESIEDRKKWPVWDADFQILHTGKNVLKNCEELRSIGSTILEVSNHFITEAYGITLPRDCAIDFCDSWFIKLRGNPEGGPFRKHNHAFSWLTGVLYLDDSDCGIQLHHSVGTNFDEDNYPFIWPEQERKQTPFNVTEIDIDICKGKCIIFNSKFYHSLINFGSTEDVRNSIAFNLWPYGNISETGGALLRYPPEPVRNL